MMDESNDKTDKSCIILIPVLDTEKGDICTRFLDMPVVNIGTAENVSSIKAGVESIKAGVVSGRAWFGNDCPGFHF